MSLRQLAKVRKWTQAAKNLLFQIQRGSFDLVCHLASSWHVSCSVCKQFGTNTASQSQVSLRFHLAVTIQAATCLVYAFATMTRRSRGLSLFASEERGDAHFGESCSWWQSSELQPMSRLGAHRVCVTRLRKAGSMGVLSNFRLPVSCAVGWPRLNEARKYMGPVSGKCSCGTQHESSKSQRASSPAIHATVCAEFLTALHRIPKDLVELNTFCSRELGNAVFSLVQDTDCTFLVVGAAMAASVATVDLLASREKTS